MEPASYISDENLLLFWPSLVGFAVYLGLVLSDIAFREAHLACEVTLLATLAFFGLPPVA